MVPKDLAYQISLKSKILKMSPFPPWWGNFPLGFKPLKYKTRLPENLTYQVSSKSDNGFRRYELKIEKSTFPPSFGGGGPHGDLIPKMHN